MMIYELRIFFLAVLLFVMFHTVRLQLYAAVSELDDLLETEEIVLESLDTYLSNEEERLLMLKWKRQQLSALHELAVVDPDQFLMSPINAYLLIKRLTADWNDINRIIDTSYTKDVFRESASHISIYPKQEDLNGAAEALLRLQDIYLLDAKNISRGQLNGAFLNAELNAGDCFTLGRHAHQTKHWKQSLFWLQEALDKYENEVIASPLGKIEIFTHMANAYNALKNFTAAAEVSESILKIDPEHIQAKNNLEFYRTREADEKNVSQPDKNGTSTVKEQTLTVNDKYNLLCRGEKRKKPEEEKQLFCYHTSNNNKYFILQPIKVEILNLKPRLVMYHDVLNDEEMEMISTLAFAKFPERVNFGIPLSIKKSARLSDAEHSAVANISRRIHLITGLNKHTSEYLQVLNYGLGGHYEPHVDYETAQEKKEKFKFGNRIASWMFYLSDVLAGGSTVFPRLGVEVKPVKGSALFWYNLHKNGTGNEETLHAACPVVVGSKWVANKWYHEYGNEFNQPCSLEQQN